MIRLQRDAQRLCERVSALGMDQNLLAKSFAALSLGTVESTAPAPSPSNIIDLQQLEADIHRRQQEEDEQLKQLQQQTAVENVSSSPSSSIQEKDEAQFEDETEKLAKAASTFQKKQSLRKDKAIKVDNSPVAPPEKELPTTTTTVAKKKKKKPRPVAVGMDVENETVTHGLCAHNLVSMKTTVLSFGTIAAIFSPSAAEIEINGWGNVALSTTLIVR
ncbi:unnamed protein product [Hydatigera taeniaeformis]|uniref:Integrase core domain containing protein n=1 Tax=Hydatigena taeniaeformis TaxID=6205 RepID=A0A0R3XD52_HYDTA|nr:unnamed protein product [Hydatigera taeniaeformis]